MKNKKLRNKVLKAYDNYLENSVRDTDEFRKELNKIFDEE